MQFIDLYSNMTKIKWTTWGIASRQGNDIWMNKDLVWHPGLFNVILQHEQNHTSGFGLKDIHLDLRNDELKGYKKEYYSFILKNPRTWIEFLPFWFYEKKLAVNPIILIIWSILLILGGLAILILI